MSPDSVARTEERERLAFGQAESAGRARVPGFFASFSQVRRLTLRPLPSLMSPPSTTLAAGAPAVRPTAEQIVELRGAVRRFIGARVKEAATADDLTQDVFLKVMRQLEHVRDPRRIMGWIFSIARHEVADHFRRARPTEEFQEKHDIAPPARPDVMDREEARLRENLAAYIRSVVHQLPAPYREALLLTEYDGLSQVELAARIGLSVSAAKSRVQRARAMVKATIERCCHFDVDRYGTVSAGIPRRCHSDQHRKGSRVRSSP